MNIEYIILIADSLSFAGKAVDFWVYSRQAHSLAICSVFRLLFCSGLGYKIEFWDCPSKAEWFLHQIVHDNITNTRVAARWNLATSIDALYSKSITSCLDVWRASFNFPTIQRHYFLTLRDKNHKPL